MQMSDIALSLDNEFITTRDCFEFKVCSCSTGSPKPDGSVFVGGLQLGVPSITPGRWVALSHSLMKIAGSPACGTR